MTEVFVSVLLSVFNLNLVGRKFVFWNEKMGSNPVEGRLDGSSFVR